MKAIRTIPDYLSVADAAERLGVTPHRVRALIRSGELSATRVSERALLVDATSVVALASLPKSAGRPYSDLMALGVLWELSGKGPEWLDYHQRRRMIAHLESLNADTLWANVRKRAPVQAFRVNESFLDDARRLVVLSGASAAMEYGFDLTSREGVVEGYATSSLLERIEEETFAERDSRGNLRIHVLPARIKIAESVMPEAVVAADLADSLNAREHAAGLSRLEGMLDEWKHSTHR